MNKIQTAAINSPEKTCFGKSFNISKIVCYDQNYTVNHGSIHHVFFTFRNSNLNWRFIKGKAYAEK